MAVAGSAQVEVAGDGTVDDGARACRRRWTLATLLGAVAIVAATPAFAQNVFDRARAASGLPPAQIIALFPDGLVEVSKPNAVRSEEHTSELQSLRHLVCRL